MNMSIAHSETRFDSMYVKNAWLGKRERKANFEEELSAFSELSAVLVATPQRALQRFLELSLTLCKAGSAGLSLIDTNEAGSSVFRWDAIAGVLSRHVGELVPRHSSLCGLCLDAGAPVVVSRPERVFKYLSNYRPLITEALVVPLYDTAKRPVGTIWIARHDDTHFTDQDAKTIEKLAIQVTLAIKLVKIQRERSEGLDLIEDYKPKLRKVTEAFVVETDRRRVAESSERALLAKLEFQNTAIHEVDHRTKNTLQIVGNLLALQSRAASSDEVRNALQEARRRLHVLARLHELLQTSDNNSRAVPMSPLLHTLSSALRESFVERSAQIELRLDVEAIVLTEDMAIPLALLANELITNAYKHAFPKGSCGIIELSLKRFSDGYTLQVTDNGIGDRSSGEANGLGHKLVRNFCKHLKGELVYSKPGASGGMTATVTVNSPTIDEEELPHAPAPMHRNSHSELAPA